MRKLSFYENSIGSVPENIGNLSNLMELNLSSNKLTLLPESFKNLAKLQELSLMWNNISTLSPHLFDEMKDLRKFLFKENQISEFPYGLTRLHNI